MTGSEKQQILDLRGQGLRYPQIAETLGLSVNTVKSFCRRNEIAGNASEEIRNKENKTICKQCGNKLHQEEKVKSKSFCSDRCRHQWWNEHRSLMHHGVSYTATCAGCGKVFESAGKGRKYCCHACYIRDRYGKEAVS